MFSFDFSHAQVDVASPLSTTARVVPRAVGGSDDVAHAALAHTRSLPALSAEVPVAAAVPVVALPAYPPVTVDAKTMKELAALAGVAPKHDVGCVVDNLAAEMLNGPNRFKVPSVPLVVSW